MDDNNNTEIIDGVRGIHSILQTSLDEQRNTNDKLEQLESALQSISNGIQNVTATSNTHNISQAFITQQVSKLTHAIGASSGAIISTMNTIARGRSNNNQQGQNTGNNNQQGVANIQQFHQDVLTGINNIVTELRNISQGLHQHGGSNGPTPPPIPPVSGSTVSPKSGLNKGDRLERSNNKWVNAYREKAYKVDENGIITGKTNLVTRVGAGAAAGIGGALELGSNTINAAKNGSVSGLIGGVSNGLMSTGNPYAMAAGAGFGLINGILDLIKMGDKGASDYARSIGGGRHRYQEMRVNAMDLIDNQATWTNGLKMDDALKYSYETSNAIGKDIGMSDEMMKRNIYLNRFGIGADAQAKLSWFGSDIDGAYRKFGDLYADVSKKGLSFGKVSKDVQNNLQMAASYTFKKGVNGLVEMAEKAASVNANLQSAARFADKVSTVEGAVQTAAQLSVLGGPFSQFGGDPMSLLNAGLNSTEEAMDKLLSMTESLGYWDKNKGQVEISAFDRQRLKSAAQAMGVDYNDLINQTQGQAKGRMIASQVGGQFGDDVTEYLKNRAVLDENGNAKIRIDKKDIDLSKPLSAEDRKIIENDFEKRKDLEGKDLEDVYGETMSIDETLNNILTFLTQKLAMWIMKIAGLDDEIEYERRNAELQAALGPDEWKRKQDDETDVEYANRMKYAITSGMSSKEKEKWEKDYNFQGRMSGGEAAWNIGKGILTGDPFSIRGTAWDVLKNGMSWKDAYANNSVLGNAFLGSKGNTLEDQVLRGYDAGEEMRNNRKKHGKGVVPKFRGPSHTDGGIPIWRDGNLEEVEGGEAIINKASTSMFGNLLGAINNGDISGIIKNMLDPMDISGSFSNVMNQTVEYIGDKLGLRSSSAVEQSAMQNGKISLEVSGTIQLEGGGQTGQIDLNALKPELTRMLAESMKKTSSTMYAYGDDKKKRQVKFGAITTA